MRTKYAFWNNKGGTGKTSLTFQAITRYAELHPNEKILAVDICPQANLSELMLGGLESGGSNNLLAYHNRSPRCSLGGYFEIRIPTAYVAPQTNARDYIITPHNDNPSVPDNIDLICGDPLLEIQANSINTVANQNLIGTDSWTSVINWLNDLLQSVEYNYDIAFFDCNPSFSLYTQIALASADKIVLPVMADDSSRRAIQNAISLVYGLALPSPIYTAYLFSTKLQAAGRPLPQIHLIVKNRITQYMGPASAYTAVFRAIVNDIAQLMAMHPAYFSFSNTNDGFVEIRDFGTTGVVAFAEGLPFASMVSGTHKISGRDITIRRDYVDNCLEAIDDLVQFL